MKNNKDLRNICGQLLIIGFDGTEIISNHPIQEAIVKHNLGGVILFDKNLKKPDQGKNIQSPEQVKRLTTDLQALTPFPLFIAVDYEGGRVNRLKPEYGFPETITPKAFAALPEKEAKIEAQKMAQTLKKSGFNLNFSPLIDVAIYAENPIIAQLDRSFSADPNVVAQYALIVAQALRNEKITFCYKHFPGHGSSRGDSHIGIVDVSDTWQHEELIPYERLLKDPLGCDMIMSAHIINRQLDPTGLPASLSYAHLTTLLRQKYQYQGLIIADDLQMNAITDAFGLEESIIMALNAGNDLLIVGNQCGNKDYSTEEIVELIVKNVSDGKIALHRIQESFERIQHAKEKY